MWLVGCTMDISLNRHGAEQFKDGVTGKHQLSEHVRTTSGRALLEYSPDTELVDGQLSEHIFNISISGTRAISETDEGGTALMKVVPNIVPDGKRETSRLVTIDILVSSSCVISWLSG